MVVGADVAVGGTAERRSTRGSTWSCIRRLRLTGLAVFGGASLALLLGAMVVAPFLTPFDPAQVSVLHRLKPPLWVDSQGLLHPLGTDQLGRDIWARLIYGAQVSLMVGFVSTCIGCVLGVFLGLLSGYLGGHLDDVIMRAAEVQLAIPGMILYLAILSVLGGSLMNIILILGITGWVAYARVVRGQVLTLRSQEFVEAARCVGVPTYRIMARHILPNVVAPIIVIASFDVGRNIVTEASLSFLGVGVPMSVPTWGAMLSEARDYIYRAWWPVVFPGGALAILVLSLNSLGDWLRDYLDPRMKNQ